LRAPSWNRSQSQGGGECSAKRAGELSWSPVPKGLGGKLALGAPAATRQHRARGGCGGLTLTKRGRRRGGARGAEGGSSRRQTGGRAAFVLALVRMTSSSLLGSEDRGSPPGDQQGPASHRAASRGGTHGLPRPTRAAADGD